MVVLPSTVNQALGLVCSDTLDMCFVDLININ